ncbi:beta strand repeat-containing protein, partial [Companilactobacillus bobalius]
MMKKKNIKYIGSAVAVALLAAGSPIIINQVIPTIVVKAAGEILPPDKAPASAKDMLTNFRNQFDDRYISSTDSLVAALQNMINTDKGTSFFYFNPQNPQYLYDIQNNKGISGLKDRDKVTELGTSPGYFGTSDSWDLTDYYYRDIKGYLSITVDGKNSPETLTHLGTNSNDSNDPDSLAQLAYEIKNKNIKLPITVGVHLVQSKDSKDGYGTTYPQGSLYGVSSDLTDFSFKVYSSRFDITKDTNQVSVSHGTSISDQNSPLQSGNDSLSVTDNFSNLTSDSEDMGRKAIYGKHLFNSASAALGYAQSNTFDPNDSTSKVEGTVDKDGKAVTGGPYYQTVSFKLDNGKDKAIEYMLSGADDDLTGTVIQPYETYINGSDTQATDGKNGDYVFNREKNSSDKVIGMLTIVRPVVVEGTIGSDLTTPQVTVGSSASPTDNSILSDTSDDKLKDESGNEFATSGIEFGTTYYKDIKTSDADVATDVVDNGKFAKTGTYYRRVTFTLANGSTNSLKFSGNNYVGTTDTTVTFSQPVTVQNGVSANIDSPSSAVGNPVSDTTSDVSGDTLSNGTDEALIDHSQGNNGISFGTDYYVDNGDSTYSDILNGKATAKPGVVDANNKFAKDGDYLRTITFYLVKGTIDTNNFEASGQTYSKDTTNNTVTYIQKVHIATSATVTLPATTVSSGRTLMGKNWSPDKTSANLPIDQPTVTDSAGKNLVNGIVYGTNWTDSKEEALKNVAAADSSHAYKSVKRLFGLDGDVIYHTVTITLIDGTSIKDEINFEPSGLVEGEDYTINGDTITYAQKGTFTSVTPEVNIDEENVNFGSKLTDIEMSTPPIEDSGVSIYIHPYGFAGTKPYNNNSDDENARSVEYSNIFYDDINHENVDSGVVINGVFAKTGSFYRKVTIPLLDGWVNGFDYSTDKNFVSVDKKNNTVTYFQKVNVTAPDVTSNITTATASVGETADNVSDNGTTDITTETTLDDGTTQTSSIIDATKTSYGNQYFTSEADALSKTDGTEGPFTTASTTDPYYRRVTLTLASGKLSDYEINGTSGTDYIDNGDGTVTFAQPVTVGTAEVTPTLKGDVTVTSGEDISSEQGNETNTITGVDGTSLVDKVTFGDYYRADNDDEAVVLADILSGNNTNTTTDPVNGTVYGKAGDYYRTVVLHLKKGALDSYTINGATDAQINKNDNTVTYLQKVTVTVPKVTSKITGATAKVGETADNVSDNGTTDITLNDGTGSIIDKTAYGDQYFTSATNALNNIDGTTGAFTTVTTSDKPYYRRVTLTLANGKLLSDYAINGISGTDYIDNGDGTVTFAQPVTVGAAEVTPTLKEDVTVTSGEDISSEQGGETNTITGVNGTSLVDKVTFGDYYPADNTDETVALTDILDGKISATTDPVNGAVYGKAGIYYRTIILHLTEGALNSYTIKGATDAQIDKDANTVTYLQKVTVEAAEFTPTLNGDVTVTSGEDIFSEQGGETNTIVKNNSIVDSVTFGSYYPADNTDEAAALADILGGKTSATTDPVNG